MAPRAVAENARRKHWLSVDGKSWYYDWVSCSHEKHSMAISISLQVKKVSKIRKSTTGVCQKTNLLGDQITHLSRRGGAFSFKKLCSRHRACNQRAASSYFARNAHGGGIDASVCSPYPARFSFSRVPKRK